MADTDEVILESKASPEQQAEAAKIGWQAPERFKGPTEKFVDADTYLERAETVLPFVREQNKRLSGDLADLRSRLESVVGENAGLKKRLEDIDIEHSTRLAKEVKRAKEEAEAELEAALESGNHKLAAKLTREVAALEQVEDTPPKPAAKSAPEVSPEAQRAMAEWNSWATENEFDKWTPRERAEFRLIGEELRQAGNRNVSRAFAEDIMAQMKRESKPAERDSKVAESRGSGSSRGGKKTGYDSLTAEEKAVCDSDSRQFVGKGKKFETVDAYRKHWVEVYERSN